MVRHHGHNTVDHGQPWLAMKNHGTMVTLTPGSEAWLFALVSRSDVTMCSLKFTSIREVSSVAKGTNMVCGPVN